MPTITPFLWFDAKAEEAMAFYRSVFANSKAGPVARYAEAGGGPGRVMTASFELEGQPFIALNGGPHFRFNEAISFLVACADQVEVDDLWEKLSAGGETSRCGWLKDRFGVSWQIVPAALKELMHDSDRARAKRVQEALMRMSRIDIAALERARDGVAFGDARA